MRERGSGERGNGGTGEWGRGEWEEEGNSCFEFTVSVWPIPLYVFPVPLSHLPLSVFPFPLSHLPLSPLLHFPIPLYSFTQFLELVLSLRV